MPIIVKKDLEMRIAKFKETVNKSNENVNDFHRKMNWSRLIVTSLEALSQHGFIILYLMEVKWSTISLATIADITATLFIVETALSQIRQIAETINRHNERRIAMEKEEPDVSLILDVFYEESNKISGARAVDSITIKPFSIQYIEESDNDKPFKLTSEEEIFVDKGEVVILYGPSGAGKSTFMKMLTEQIKIEKSTEIPATANYMFYDEKLRFGSLPIFEELFCCEPNPDYSKMQDILENLHLWYEIESNCIDVWTWMKQKDFNKLSNGQKQRLILAKMLYWMDNSIDVLVLDECTSGLDDKSEIDSADAERILEYIVRYANSDKKRIVIISTHQNIDGFKKKLENEVTFSSLRFTKTKGESTVTKI